MIHLFKLGFVTLAATLMAAASSFAVTFTTNTVIPCGDLTYDGQSVVVNGCILTVDCEHSFASLTLINNAQVKHTPAQIAGVTLNISGSVSIEAGSSINMSYQGYPMGQGPGAGQSSGDGTGAGHGGKGGPVLNTPGGTEYDSTTEPALCGSGGGEGQSFGGGTGGGRVRLNVNGTLTNNGAIYADGQNGFAPSYAGGGGSGGSISIHAATILGNGLFSAIGGTGGSWGSGGGGGGSGGRIALHYDNFSFTGSIIAQGGLGWNQASAVNGGPGTIFRQRNNSSTGELLVDNVQRGGQITAVTDIASLDSAVVRNAPGAKLSAVTYSYIEADSALVELQRSVNTANSIHILPAGVLSVAPDTVLQLTVATDVTIDNGGELSVWARGFDQGMGPGSVPFNTSDGPGAGYGGFGGLLYYAAGGAPYGSITAPVDLGSGGGQGTSFAGGRGGGALRLTVNGTLYVYGTISADGENGRVPSWAGGGGSGGSLYITTYAIFGSGPIHANGGTGGTWNSGGAGGGAGGRIAVYFTANNFSGVFRACSGNGWDANTDGGAGTVYLKRAADPAGDLAINACGATYTPRTPVSNLAALQHVVVDSGAYVEWHGATTCNTLVVTHDTWLTTGVLDPLDLTVTGNCLIGASARIDANGCGYGPGQGPGAGASINDAGGGGYGGMGGNGFGGELGGPTYGSESVPNDFGSGGGQGQSNGGARGGGIIHFSVSGVLTIDGHLSANGANGTAPYWSGGGGSGGSIQLVAGALVGSGYVTANGGNGGAWGTGGSGGGGGGRISLPACADSAFFAGAQVNGGQGAPNAQNGHPGTIHFTPSTADCNNNGTPDECDLATGTSQDCNGNAIPDECEAFDAPRLTIHRESALIRLYWPCVPTADRYYVYRAATVDVPLIPGNLLVTATAVTYDDTSALNSGLKYFYRIVAERD